MGTQKGPDNHELELVEAMARPVKMIHPPGEYVAAVWFTRSSSSLPNYVIIISI